MLELVDLSPKSLLVSKLPINLSLFFFLAIYLLKEPGHLCFTLSQSGLSDALLMMFS